MITINCASQFNATVGSIWIVTMNVSYTSSTATNTNYINFLVYTVGNSWSNIQVVNFGLSDTISYTETFVICFTSNTDLVIEAQLMVDPPTGKTCKIDYLSLQFTRLA